LGQAQQAERLPYAPGGCAAGGLAARFDLKRSILTRFWRDERGATAIEYSLICAMVFLVIVTAMTAFGNHASNIMSNVSTAIAAATG
jgi:pilus assembly protein Flp/PilA